MSDALAKPTVKSSDPLYLQLLLVHSIAVSRMCFTVSFVLVDLSCPRNDIAGFQNRLGLFFFTLALFGFSCLSSLGLFANERILFMRERCVILCRLAVFCSHHFN